jgi:hypothetical protein
VNPYLTSFIVEAHATELGERARQAGLARAARTGHRRSKPVRSTTARLLVAVAARLDNRRRPAAVPCADTGAGT